MLHAFFSSIIFFISFTMVSFFPGYFLMLAIFGKNNFFLEKIERFILSFGLGIIVTDFIAFIYAKSNIPINRFSSIFGIIIFILSCWGIYKFKKKKENIQNNFKKEFFFSFDKNQIKLLFVLIFFTFFIKTAYLEKTVVPTATDMGHHAYWINSIVKTGQLPDYDGMPDFIIGEHIALSEIIMISGLKLFDASPVVFLLINNILGIFTIFILTLRIFKNKNIAIFSLLFLGVLFAVSSPQAKFVSGGVMGNILGNYLLPMTLYFYFRAFEFLNEAIKIEKEKAPEISPVFLGLGIFSTFGLFYTHHLSAFVFLFAFALWAIFFLILNIKQIKNIFKKLFLLIFSKSVLISLFLCLFFFFFVFTPNYIKTNAVGETIGVPSKSTREGLSLDNLQSSLGEFRLLLGILGILILFYLKDKKKVGTILICAWTIMLFIMSAKPGWIFINIPSNRIGTYLSYPLSILSAITFFSFFAFFRKKTFFQKNETIFNVLPAKMALFVFFLTTTFVLAEGLGDSAQTFKEYSDFSPTLKTFSASQYLKEKTEETDILLKDHNYLSGDTWMKLFFMRGYDYPVSRGYFKRYEDPTKPREMCTLYMISNPGEKQALECFQKTATNFIVVNPHYDSSQFAKLKNFNQIYTNGEVAIFYRK